MFWSPWTYPDILKRHDIPFLILLFVINCFIHPAAPSDVCDIHPTMCHRWAIHCFKKFDFEEELADGTLFEGETLWILEESPERTTKAVLSSLGDDGLKMRRS
ncbi:hypothetical protein AVEN_213781-1 [Araneus ventricosus]|uniref:Uncharacterized protein n=1 Tax=Araneus ventricosus TaxID=182803 RepID=A0A4Y2J975_ARAVE|nr:hypothetical protein AVEN_213781-1 [Araneus ventricosus]